MKALSIQPTYTMDIFMGVKTIEYRTWSTDYRGDLLICASSQKEPGYVCGYAFMVVPLLDIRESEEEGSTASGKKTRLYEWLLGMPRLIQPVPVKGKLHLFDVDDALIQYVENGDLGTCNTKEDADALRTAYARQFLDPLAYHTKDSGTGVRVFDFERELDKLLNLHSGEDALDLDYAFIREPFYHDFMDIVGLHDEAAFLDASKTFMEIASSTFSWKDYLDARQTAEQTFRAFYQSQRYPEAEQEDALKRFLESFYNLCIDRCQFEWEDAHPGEEMPLPPEDDIHTLLLARLFSCFFPDKKDLEFCNRIGVQYDFEQLHMCCWFSNQITLNKASKAYARNELNYSARVTYNRLRDANSLLWICTVLGTDREKLARIAEEIGTRRNDAAACKVVRREVPFDELLGKVVTLLEEYFPE